MALEVWVRGFQVVERLVKCREKPFTGDRGELQPGGLNHSSMACWGRLGLDWTILMSGHEPDHSKGFQTCGEELDLGEGVTLSSQAYQMEFEVFSLIGTITPAMGCSRSRGVGSATGLAWCLGEPKREDFS